MIMASQESQKRLARPINLRIRKSNKNIRKVSANYLGSLATTEREQPLKNEKNMVKIKKSITVRTFTGTTSRAGTPCTVSTAITPKGGKKMFVESS